MLVILEEELSRGLKMTKNGVVFAFETDTVWGLGADINDKIAIEKIYELKNRDKSKPLILMSNCADNLLPFVKNIPKTAFELIEKHFPGALTLILEKSNLVPDFLNPGFTTIGIRVPNHTIFTDFCKKNDNLVLATTSANISSEEPCKNTEEVKEKFGKNVEIISNDFKSKNTGKSSTIIAFENDSIKILRQGDVII